MPSAAAAQHFVKRSRLPAEKPMTQRKDPNRYPKGFNRKKIQAILEYYENQTEEEAAAEIEAAFRKRPTPRRKRRRGTVGYQRQSADGSTALVPAAGLPVGRLPASQGTRLLVISCSERKNPNRRLMPAVERYDGPAFRVLRKYLRETDDASLRVCVLSAKYGIVRADSRVPKYDQRMTPDRAEALRNSSESRLRNLVRRGRCREVFLCMSRTYLRAIDCAGRLCVPVRIAAAGQGKKLRSLREWLCRSRESAYDAAEQ
jgi:hypothetical protein